MKKKILIAVTSHDKKGSTGQPTGAYVGEISHPVAEFVAQGFEVEFVSPKGGQVPLDGVDRNDPVNAAFLDNAPLMQQLHSSSQAKNLKASDYAGIFFAGGHGTMWDFPDCSELSTLAGKIYDDGGVVGAVCHGPAGLVNVKLASGAYLVAGKNVSAFTNDEEEAAGLTKVVPFLLADKLVSRGATHVPAPNWQAQVVVSERLVTGQNPASAKGVAVAMGPLLNQSGRS
jgi:putative intracellular protease/amidase